MADTETTVATETTADTETMTELTTTPEPVWGLRRAPHPPHHTSNPRSKTQTGW